MNYYEELLRILMTALLLINYFHKIYRKKKFLFICKWPILRVHRQNLSHYAKRLLIETQKENKTLCTSLFVSLQWKVNFTFDIRKWKIYKKQWPRFSLGQYTWLVITSKIKLKNFVYVCPPAKHFFLFEVNKLKLLLHERKRNIIKTFKYLKKTELLKKNERILLGLRYNKQQQTQQPQQQQ